MIKHPLILAAVGIAALACILQVVGVATPGWTTYDTAIASANYGLWKACLSTMSDGKVCSDWDVIPDWLKAVRAFGILAILVMAAATVVGVLVVLNETMSGMIVFAVALDFAGTLCSVIGFAIYAGEDPNYLPPLSPTFGYSFALCIVGAVLSSVSGGCLLAGKSKLSVQ